MGERERRRHPDLADKALDRVEQAFALMLEDRKKGSGDVAIPTVEAVRNHQDAKDIEFSWTRADLIGRNVHVVLLDPEGFRLGIEINAWRDNEQPDGSGIRNWQNQGIDSLSSHDSNQLSAALRRAYDEVSRWGEQDLIMQESLQPFPGASRQ